MLSVQADLCLMCGPIGVQRLYMEDHLVTHARWKDSKPNLVMSLRNGLEMVDLSGSSRIQY